MAFRKTIQQAFQLLSPDAMSTDALALPKAAYWRERILDVIYRSVALLGGVAYVPSVYLALAEKLWWLAVFNTIGYGWFIGATFARRVSSPFRSAMLLAFIYLLGVALLVELGPFAAGPIWLFTFPVMTSLLFGLRPAIGALLLNALTVGGFGIALANMEMAIGFMPPNMASKWWVISANFLLLDTVLTLSIGVLLRGLDAALEQQRAMRRSLEQKHAELQRANENLRREFAERRRAEEEIKHSHEILVTVLDSIDVDVFVADIETHEILLMNRHMRETFGGDLTGAKCWEAFQNRSGPCETCYSAGIVDERGEATGLLVWEGESPVTGRRYINFDRAIRWTDGRLVRLQIAMDITDLARMQEEKLQLEKQLRQAQKMEAIGTLAGGIAHDFNNILAAVLGYAEIALDECRGQPPLDGYLGEILKASHRAKDLTRQILTFSRQAEVAPKPVRIKSIVREAVKLLRASLPTTIAIEEDLDCNATVMADPTQLHQVVMNLATNAAHAMERGGGVLSIALEEAAHLSVPSDTGGAGEARSFVRLTIADTGHGIDPSIRERIFDPYFTTKDKGKGTGMGLSVVHGIVKNYGGEIEVDSIIGEGAVFRIMLPLQPLDQMPPEAVPPAAAVSGHERILVVDDEPQIAQVLTLMLESLGYQVTAFTSSREARQTLEQRPQDFDLLITDMTMPELTGDELARAVLAKHPDMRIILCTGFNEQMTEDRARRIGIRRLIHKPVLRRTLAEEVRRALED